MDVQQKKKKKQYLNFWEWVIIIVLLLGLIVSGVLIYQEWNRQQKLKELQTQLEQKRQEVQQEYELQQKHLISIKELENNSKVKEFFSDLLKTYSEKFAESKNIDTYSLPLKFESFHLDKNVGNGYGEMGTCWRESIIYPKRQEIANISLNRLYLLNKFGCERYFTSNPAISDDYTYIDISFDKMIDTCSHELGHYIQLVKYGRSSCESDFILKNGNYDEELAKEHEKFTQEIYQMIKNSGEYSELERRWKEIK